MAAVKINTTINKITAFCIKHISPMEYYLPNNQGVKVGGVGWEVSGTRYSGTYVDIEDEQYLTLFILQDQ